MSYYTIQTTGEIDLSGEVLQLLDNLYMSNEQSDVTFLVENTEIPAHKTILSIRSVYFQRLFSGSFTEATQNKIELKVPLEAFKVMLKYVYTGRISLVGLNVDQIVEMCGLAEQYYFESLKKTISAHLISILSLENCNTIFNAACLYSLEELQSKSLEFMDIHCSELLTHDTFKIMSQYLICSLLARDTFYAHEIDIFQAVRKWYTYNPYADAKLVFSGIRWSIMSSDELMNTVLKSDFLEPKQHMLEVMGGTNISDKARKKICVEGENVASTKEKTMVIIKDLGYSNSSGLLDVEFGTYDFKGYAYHCIGKEGFIIKLGKVHIINHIKFLLRSDKSRKYAYTIDLSLDGNEYKTIVDHTNCFCRSWQDLYFPSRFVQYIRLKGVNSRNETDTYNGCYKFQVFGLEAMYRTEQLDFIDGFMKPSYNVATIERYARVIHGVGGKNMLDRKSEEFTCHEIGSGAIIVQLNQSYWIDSVGILLGNNRYRSNKYSLYIETSTDNKNWTMAIDKRNEKLSSWQQFTFNSRVAIFIKIVGTQQDVNLICSYFECPSPRKTIVENIMEH